ncbi:uncharacterized protein [Primulina huaijiensis]|uniref:uncharacterized protein isoform X2 n=1 Tax=Primulina huaijiensis TaxID=1492673 RepID=UPI003CC72348
MESSRLAIHWGHPCNMAVVLFAMGGYGAYLGFRIRFSDCVSSCLFTKKRLWPKLCILNLLEECSSSLLLELLVESRLFSLQINPFLKGESGIAQSS